MHVRRSAWLPHMEGTSTPCVCVKWCLMAVMTLQDAKLTRRALSLCNRGKGPWH